MRGTISPANPWDVMVDLFFYREPEEAKEDEPAEEVTYPADAGYTPAALPAPGERSLLVLLECDTGVPMAPVQVWTPSATDCALHVGSLKVDRKREDFGICCRRTDAAAGNWDDQPAAGGFDAAVPPPTAEGANWGAPAAGFEAAPAPAAGFDQQQHQAPPAEYTAPAAGY